MKDKKGQKEEGYMAAIFDSHAHYDAEAFDRDREELLAALPGRGVEGVICAADSLASANRCIALAERYPYIWAAAGIHPENAGAAAKGDMDRLRELCRSDKVVAVGEIGLDYHYEDACPREIQRYWMEKQLALAVELGLPVIVHDREAHEDVLRLLTAYRPAGVVHCFSGSVEMMREVVRLGMSIGLGGVVTFKNARRPVEVAAAVPGDRLLLETDAPYMAPVPFRGKRCDSSMIAHTAARIAEIRETTVEALLEQTAANTRRLFRLD